MKGRQEKALSLQPHLHVHPTFKDPHTHTYTHTHTDTVALSYSPPPHGEGWPKHPHTNTVHHTRCCMLCYWCTPHSEGCPTDSYPSGLRGSKSFLQVMNGGGFPSTTHVRVMFSPESTMTWGGLTEEISGNSVCQRVCVWDELFNCMVTWKGLGGGRWLVEWYIFFFRQGVCRGVLCNHLVCRFLGGSSLLLEPWVANFSNVPSLLAVIACSVLETALWLQMISTAPVARLRGVSDVAEHTSGVGWFFGFGRCMTWMWAVGCCPCSCLAPCSTDSTARANFIALA